MSAASLLPPVAEGYLPRKKFTRTEVYQMLEAGVFAGARFELIHGDVIDKMGQSARHANAIATLSDLFFISYGRKSVRTQLPLELHERDRDHSEPEPDLVVVDGSAGKYLNRLPRGDEAILVVEVAETSLRGDMTLKRDLYARAGVRQYWVLDVVNRRLTVHRNPSKGKYADVTTLTAADSVPVPDRAGATLAVAEFFE